MILFIFSSQSKELIVINQLTTDVKICYQEMMISCRKLIGFLIRVFFQIQIQQPEQLVTDKNFAKQQLTWFRNEHIYNWLDASKPLETVLDFIYDAYHDNTENLVVRESLRMKKELTSHREVAELKAYRPKNSGQNTK
ncbi:tRNA dimethylallyltransferase 9-like isoform X2 [Pyrus x bretschneideri]|uniref:tRNA dimethylallyltransferase 9-like isoform X2 n=1 Tax=Pyrus x bretschneideri TaxID=225117 RepID=UPI00203051F7|nr:tRNA dimethylallyltransferase 9-like isoform X2 [Pyrus x bretschneideri]